MPSISRETTTNLPDGELLPSPEMTSMPVVEPFIPMVVSYKRAEGFITTLDSVKAWFDPDGPVVRLSDRRGAEITKRVVYL